jgi:DNA-dependent RNA polymerase auxiliary subunit epsilon
MNKQQSFTEFGLSRDGYLAFDAITLKQLIINRLNESGIFTDQNFEGSNTNAFIDIVAYMYHVLLFYLNTTSSESTFTTATLYENISKLISNINYKPQGQQTSLVTISLTGTDFLQPGVYTIPRFTSAIVNGIQFTSIDDISFEKTTNSAEPLSIDSNILYQGRLVEFPQFVGTGEPFEIVTIINNEQQRGITDNLNQRFIADNSFSVFIKDTSTQQWIQWEETSSLYLEGASSNKYEKRINEYGNYEFKFGNDLYGRQLKEGDSVQIYFIESDNKKGIIGSNALANSKFVLYTSPVFEEIKSYIYPNNTSILSRTSAQQVLINNSNASTPVVDAESAEDIKANAPKIFSLQNRLVTKEDYESFISKTFNNVVKSVSVLSNDEYTNGYLRYFYSLGLDKPNQDTRVLFNQVNYAGSTSFNNVYVFAVPTQDTVLNGILPNYLNPTQKQLLVNECNNIKDLTHSVIPSDPVYLSFALGLSNAGETVTKDIISKTFLVIKKDKSVSINSSSIKQSISNIFRDEFAKIKLGSTVNIANISNSILSLAGVQDIITRRSDTNTETSLISMLVWNPVYETGDIKVTSQNVKLEPFQYAFYSNISSIADSIIIE